MIDRFGADGPVALVVTSVNPPTRAMAALAEGARVRDIDFVVVGDARGPASFDLPDVHFLGYDDQLKSDYSYARACPPGHYARKNIGYLEAVRLGAQIVVETDDDNFPREAFFDARTRHLTGDVYGDAGWVNVYGLFSEKRVWPRGFPLRAVHSPPSDPSGRGQTVECAVQNGLADEDPDVDAVYRLVADLPIAFDERPPVILRRGSWCPFNSQNTTFFMDSLPLAYLPRRCSFRMTDIWRSFVAQRVMAENDWALGFHGPTVWQERNDHDLMVDFADEVPGYLHNEAIVEQLTGLDLPRGTDHLFEAMRSCYEQLVEMGVVGSDELDLLQAFEDDIVAAGWNPGQDPLTRSATHS